MNKIEYKNYTINIFSSDYADCPRKIHENLGNLALFHKRYRLVNDESITLDQACDIEKSSNYISLPVYGYDHGGLTIGTNKFSCPYDSGRLGLIYVSKDDIKKCYNVKRISNKLKKSINEILLAEISDYNYYISGEIYDFSIHNHLGEEIDAISGFYGYDEALKESKEYIDGIINYEANKLPVQLSLPLY